MIRNRKVEGKYFRLEKWQNSTSELEYLINEDTLLNLYEHRVNKNYQGKSKFSKMLEELREQHDDIFDDLFG
jgi:hypothetical protein